VTGFIGDGRRVEGVEAVDEETGEALTLRARHIACAAGVWTDRVRELAGGASTKRIVPSKGIHIFVAGDKIRMRTGILSRTEKSVLFVIPWQGGWLIGDTDTPWTLGPDEPVATGADVEYLLARTNALLAEPLSRDDVHGVIVGLRPLVADVARSDTTRISRQHVIESPIAGLTTIAGGKFTTYRVMAADLVDAAAGALGSTARSVTRDVPLLGARGLGAARAGRDVLAARAGVPADAIDALLARHGDRVEELVALMEARPALAQPLEGAGGGDGGVGGGGGHLRAEVVHACLAEGALHVEDVLERRTRLALTAPDRGLAAAAPVAALMAGELGWGADRARDEVEAWRARVAARRAAEAECGDERALAAHRAVLADRCGAAVQR
jgi:glycerol-3-phosphate dehydrogenase